VGAGWKRAFTTQNPPPTGTRGRVLQGAGNGDLSIPALAVSKSITGITGLGTGKRPGWCARQQAGQPVAGRPARARPPRPRVRERAARGSTYWGPDAGPPTSRLPTARRRPYATLRLHAVAGYRGGYGITNAIKSGK